MTKNEMLQRRMAIADEECAARKQRDRDEVEATYNNYHERIEMLNDAEQAALVSIRAAFSAQREKVRADFGLNIDEDESPVTPASVVVADDAPAAKPVPKPVTTG